MSVDTIVVADAANVVADAANVIAKRTVHPSRRGLWLKPIPLRNRWSDPFYNDMPFLNGLNYDAPLLYVGDGLVGPYAIEERNFIFFHVYKVAKDGLVVVDLFYNCLNLSCPGNAHVSIDPYGKENADTVETWYSYTLFKKRDGKCAWRYDTEDMNDKDALNKATFGHRYIYKMRNPGSRIFAKVVVPKDDTLAIRLTVGS